MTGRLSWGEIVGTLPALHPPSRNGGALVEYPHTQPIAPIRLISTDGTVLSWFKEAEYNNVHNLQLTPHPLTVGCCTVKGSNLALLSPVPIRLTGIPPTLSYALPQATRINANATSASIRPRAYCFF